MMDMDECLLCVYKNKLSFSVDLATDSKSVVGGQCTAGRELKSVESSSCVALLVRGVSHFID